MTPHSTPSSQWQAASEPPALKTDERPDLILLLLLSSGYCVSGEYDHKLKCYFTWRERYMGTSPKGDQVEPDLIDQNLDWSLEESDEVEYWMWITRPDA